MARPLRIEYKNACYHVINRGNHKDVIFTDDRDCELFIEKLADFAELYDVIIYTYCLMPNHFHLQIRTSLPNLGAFMQTFLTAFTVCVNRRHQKSGHLFQGRYKAQLVESDLYKNKLSRYIHLNPIKVKGLEDFSSEKLKSRLDNYKWSSYRSYLGLEKKAKWLNRRFVLSSWGVTGQMKLENYQKYVEKGIPTNNSDDIDSAKSNGIMGSDTFKKIIVNKYLKHSISDIDSREQPILATVNSYSVDDIIDAVTNYYQIKEIEKVTVRRECHLEARKMAMFLVAKYCRRRETLTYLASRFGVKISGLNMAINKFKKTLKEKPSFLENLTAIENGMNYENNKMEV